MLLEQNLGTRVAEPQVEGDRCRGNGRDGNSRQNKQCGRRQRKEMQPGVSVTARGISDSLSQTRDEVLWNKCSMLSQPPLGVDGYQPTAHAASKKEV